MHQSKLSVSVLIFAPSPIEAHSCRHRCWESSWFFPQFVASEYRDMISMEMWDEYFPDRTWHLNEEKRDEDASGSKAEQSIESSARTVT